MGTNTGIGIGIGIPFKNNALGGDRPYLPPELKARLIGVWDNYGKKNTDADRNIIKNKIPNAGGDLEILNAAYKLNSGFGEYKEDFTSWRIYPNIEVTDNVITTNGNFNSTWFIYKHANENEINEMNIKVSGIPEGGIIRYFYIPDETATIPVSYNISEDGVYHLPKSKLSSNRVSIGFTVSSSYDWNNIRIEQLSDFGGAFVTDGVNDIIISQKTLQEMGVTKDFTIVSMIHQISWRGSGSVPLTNYIRPTDNIYVRNQVADIGKTGIYGYVIYDVNNTSVNNSRIINTVLGDKNDYSIYTVGNLSQGKFSVQGYISSKGNIIETSRVAHYWTFALLGKATEDDINLIIAYFNLDRTLKPDIRCNIERQGITNDNHADFNDKLIDYSGNGRDIQMYNLAWKGGSGIAAKQYETFKDWTSESSSTSIIKQIDEFTRIVESTTNGYWVSRIRRDSDLDKVYSPINVYLYQDNNFLVHECKYEIDGVKYAIPINEPVGKGYHKLEMYTKDRYTELPENAENVVLSEWYFPKSTKGSIKYSIIPSCKGGILLDGINDFGKVTGMPIYKDYTVIADYIRISAKENAADASILSKSKVINNGAFLFNYLNVSSTLNSYSFGTNNLLAKINDSERKIYYQSKYVNDGKSINSGTGTDYDSMWLGTYRDNVQIFFNGAIYSLMSFPYSMSEFLIERQLKKYKLGTLYPNMVEFRPIIKSNIDILKINYWDKDWNVVNVGDYISVGNDIKTNITVPNGYKVSKVTSDAFDNITIEKSSTDFIYDVIFYGIKKSPQKINLVIEQDSDYVQWNPNIKANVSKYSVTANIRKTDGTTLKLVNGQFYSTSITGNLVLDIVPPYKDSDEVTNVVIDGKSYTPTKDSSGNYYRLKIPLVFPKEINITIQEYVRYEDIVQPYPVLLRFKDENNNEISWGDKIKLGSSITRIGLFNDCNLLKDIYTVSNAKLNGNPLTSTPHVVERQMVFTCTATWIFDDNEPNCILSPRLLHAPNSSYKILGHIPDISGHGNHGVIYNSAYKLNSGANGYLVDFTTLRDYGTKGIVRTDSKIYLDESFDYDNGFWLGYTNSPSPAYKVRVSGIPETGILTYTGGSWLNLVNGINELPARTNTAENHGFYAQTPNVDWSNLVIEQIGEYEGAYCLDGVDDFITIPTLSKGGKQVLMKVNWSTLNGFIYDQRPTSGDKTFGIYAQGDVIAYSQHNNGNTYIDGIINNNIIGNNLSKITHNIVATCDVDNSITPLIGKRSYSNSYFAQMSLYDFMLFDEISTEAKIKELNTYIGITPKVTLPNYYWDNYGKKNTDANRGYIDEQVSLQKTGTSVNPLENFNIGYEGMSGYNGYPVVLGANKTWEISNAVDYIYDINSTIVHITNVKHAANGLLYSYVKKDGALANIKEIPAFRVTVKGLEENSKLIYKYLATENATKESIVYLGNGIHKLPKSFVPTDALLDLTTNSWIGFTITPMIEGELVFDCDITIEILPEYENGLAYDGISDFSQNTEIEVVEDFTFLVKGSLLKGLTGSGGCIARKGDKNHYDTGGYAFIYCFDSPIESYRNSYYSFGKSFVPSKEIVAPPLIGYMTKTNVNGETTTFGTNSDIKGIIFGNWSSGYMNMVIYKSIFYTKTISLLEINFLKNLMEKDEIIDINHPIFISNTEDESNTSQDT